MALKFLNDGYFAGKVGIGIQSPAAKLHVNPTTTDEIAIAINGTQNYSAGEFQRIAAGDASSINRLSIGFGYDNPTDWAIRYSSYGRHEFYTGNDWGNAANTEKMVITSSGNVGIGTASPAKTLDVNGDVYINSNYPSNAAASDLTIGKTTTGDHGLTIVTGASNTAGIFFADNNNNDAGRIKYQHSSNSMRFDTNRSEAMRINSSGNVGIGTTLPQSKLQANGGDGLTVTANDTAYNQGYFGRIQSDYGTNPLRLVSRSGDVFRATAFGAAVSILTGPTSGTSEKLRITSAGGVSFGTTGTAYGTSGQILKSNGNASPTWIDGSAIPGVPAGSGTLNTIPLWTPDGDTLGNSVMTQSGANIGIGTTSYTNSSGYSTLNINGTSGGQIAFQTAGASKHFIWGTATDFNIYNGQAGPLILYTSATERMRITSTGNVGIGTTSPGTKLQVGTGSGATVDTAYQIVADGSAISGIQILSGATQSGRLVFGDSGNNDIGIIKYDHSNNSLQTIVNAAERMRIIDNGNVGIGTTSPNHKLDIYSNENVPLRIHRPNNANLNSDGAWGIGFSTRGDAVTSTTDTRSGIFSYYNGNLFLATNNTRIDQDPFDYARLTILSGGNVGIGTTSPSVQLDIEDSSNVIVDVNTTTANANTTIRLQESGSVKATIGYDGTNDGLILTTGGFTAGNGIFIDDSQNVGIGTASPDRKLHVNSGSTNIVATFESTDATAAISLQDNSTTNDSKVQIRAIGDDFNIVAGGSQRVTVNSSGNVGIGTTSPAYKLDVESSTTPLHLNRTGGATALIGLDINGTTRGLLGATTTAAFVSYSTAAAPLVTVANTGGVQFNTYGAGTLVTDASGNITVSSGGGAGGPYLPLAGGTLTGALTGTSATFTGNISALGGSFTDPVTIYDSTISENPRLSVGRNAGEAIQFDVTDRVATIRHKNDSDSNQPHDLDFIIDTPSSGNKIFNFGVAGNTTSTYLTIDSTGATFTGNVNLPTANYLRFTSAASGSDARILYGNTTGTNGSIAFTRNSDSSTMFKVTGSGNAEITGKGTSSATITSDGSSTLTTKGYVDSLITGATIYRGTWDPDVSLNSGYGNPNLNTVTQTSGYYYICMLTVLQLQMEQAKNLTLGTLVTGLYGMMILVLLVNGKKLITHLYYQV